MNSNKHEPRHACLLYHLFMYVSVFLFYYNKNDQLLYISFLFSKQGLPEVNEFLFIQ